MTFRFRDELKIKHRMWVGGTAAIIILVVIFSLNQISFRQPPSGTWLTVTPAPLNITLGLSGYIDNADRQTLYAPFAGTVSDLRFNTGDVVKSGQTLLVLDTADIDIQIRQAYADLLKARSEVARLHGWAGSSEVQRARRMLSAARGNLTDVSSKLEESRSLYHSGIIARQEVDALVRQHLQQQSELQAAEDDLKNILAQGSGINAEVAALQLTNAQQRYDQLISLQKQKSIVAPFSGNLYPPQTVEGKSAVVIQSGAKVSPDMPLFELARQDRLRVVAAVNEADVNQLSEGQHVEVTGDAFSSLRLSGEVRTVGISRQGKASAGESGTYEVVAMLAPLTQDQQRLLRPGMSARMSVLLYQKTRALIVPSEALQNRRGKTILTWRYPRSQKQYEQQVITGHSTPAGLEISQGLPDKSVDIWLPTQSSGSGFSLGPEW
ncbi:HlyD family efflux transporter periplasmic adaptor subunit (plasmid) [Enterobacter bugandensis]|uniref:efflux RND transporter periplasmic adaptor subunit n=1 Tax=Enterobacter bugandensis TaxID=881260 RepID=UPI00283A981F|nr:HlyD family efflux transporter periplasmic adaptor subunit [Enterobacter bugandensis]WMU75479.1 HlyD family efflux transporter periplasmic adaptor subunit [Enterobacter bugandensis]